MPKKLFKPCLWLIAPILSACSPVQPWERGNLAKNVMGLEMSSAQSSLRQHIYASREAAGAATSGAAGGGCGCN